ncbi:Acetylglucosaminyltransferase EXT1/exostosin 1 [Handroanthus impetiginosus]|uniref:Acetylglucosaminyltransferase EXT1/exostosin 1 n=1 Tax=Handroanthus impetiginosus TaxID=429701 RepID=A0A2G9GZ37_9LAMI|nr:Acetylglucosaminyltransferase EXT1/exostosin 1 [Handroanthus impetiginosus]
MEMRRLMWFMALAFSVALLVQYIELPYGYVLSSLLSFGKSQVTPAGSFLTRGSSSNQTGNLANQMSFSGVNSMKTNDAHESLNLTKFSGEKNENGRDYVKCETNKHCNDSFGIGNDPEVGYLRKDFSGIKPVSTDERVARNKSMTPEKANSSYTSTNNSSFGNLQMRNATPASVKRDYKISQIENPLVPSPPHNLQAQVLSPDYIGTNQTARIQSPWPSSTSMGKDAESMLLNSEKSGLKQSDASSFNNTSIVKTRVQKRRFKGPPAKVVPISAMNDMLRQSRVSYRSLVRANLKSLLTVKPDLLANAHRFLSPETSVACRSRQRITECKSTYRECTNCRKELNIDVNVYRNFSAFIRSYELMEQTLKIYIYTEGERPIFHQPELHGIYASEGWFMKQLEQNKHFVTKNAHKAHLFYLPFSSRVLQEVLYIPNSHSRRNLVLYLSSYLQTITTTYPFWKRTDGADHFLVACHDWAPAETSRIMKNCIRALCNADVRGGFKFGKDVSLPEIYVRDALNPLKGLGGKPPSQRRILAFFAGHMHGYLRPILLSYWENTDPDMKIFGKLQNTKSKSQMTYIQYMKSSKYCISAKGYEPYTPRSFTVFVLEEDIPNLKNILMSIPEQEYLKMQQRVRQVQKHFLWNHTPVKYDVFHMILHSIWYTRVFQMRPG